MRQPRVSSGAQMALKVVADALDQHERRDKQDQQLHRGAGRDKQVDAKEDRGDAGDRIQVGAAAFGYASAPKLLHVRRPSS